ncbi:MAG: hypothetical protein K2Q18_07980 [Bdellovibrionales bacterium]|nr:hypothetical protein [Bdellovibrionales bacterium]
MSLNILNLLTFYRRSYSGLEAICQYIRMSSINYDVFVSCTSFAIRTKLIQLV